MYKYLTWEEWYNHYKPKTNHIRNYGSDLIHAYETYGDEQDFIFAQDPKFVWTEVDGDGGSYLIAGIHYVNRVQYYVCENAWDNDNQEVCVNYYRECPTCGCYGGYGTTDNGGECPECSNESDDLVLYPDNREDLIEVYGKEAVNEQV